MGIADISFVDFKIITVFSGPATKALPPPLELFFVLKQPKTDFDNNNKNFPTIFGLKEPYLDVILYLGNQRYQPPPPIKNP